MTVDKVKLKALTEIMIRDIEGDLSDSEARNFHQHLSDYEAMTQPSGVLALLAEIDQRTTMVTHQEALLEQKRVEIYEEATNAVESYKRVTEIKALLTYAYNSGYMAGHHDTVEGQFTDIHHADMRTHHLDVVAEIIAEHDEGGKEAASVTITLSGCAFTENELLEQVMRNIDGVNRYGTQRWVRVKDVFGVGSGVSHALCRRFGMDPDQNLKK